MGPLLLLPLLWGGSLQELPGFELRVQESVTVQACMDVGVPCSFSYPWSSAYWSAVTSIYWFREGDKPYNDAVATNDRNKPVKPETQGRFRLVGDPRDKDCSLSIEDARLSDSGAYYLRVEKAPNEKYSYHDKKLNLQVTVPAEKPDIQFVEPLESGRPTQLTCSLSLVCAGRKPLQFSWAGDALDEMDPETLHFSKLTLTPRPQDHGSNLTCQVTLQGAQVTLERTVQLNVSYAPRNVRISLSFRNVTALKILQNTSSLLISETPALQLLCVADSNPPAQLSWFQGSPALEAARISSTGVLALPYLESAETEFTCRAQNALGSQNTSLNLFMVSPPHLLGPSCSQEDEGLRCSCSSQARPAASLRWRLGEGLLEGNFSNASFEVTSSSAGPWANSSLSLREGLSSGLSLSCEALNVYGVRSGSALLLPVKARRKQAATRPEGVDDEDPVMGTVAWGSRQKPCSDSPPDQTVLSPAEDAPPPGEQEELHYASLSFHEMTSREPQEQEETSTEYSEIKTS